MITASRAQQLVGLNAKVAAAPTFKVHLLKTLIVPTPDTPIATFTAAEANFTGYAAKALGALGTPYIDPVTGAYVAAGIALDWQMTDALAPNTIYGVFITDTTSADIEAYEMFATPIPLSVALQGLQYVPVMAANQ